MSQKKKYEKQQIKVNSQSTKKILLHIPLSQIGDPHPHWNTKWSSRYTGMEGFSFPLQHVE